MKKILAAVLALSLLLALAGCGARTSTTVDNTKTQLIIGNWNGGVGSEWLNKAIEKFQEKYADYSFEDGKKGVQVVIGSNNKTTMEGSTLKDLILTNDNKDDIFFTEGVFYQTYVQNNLLLDITEYVEEDLTEFGESESIADKMDPTLLEGMKVDGKIYAVPFWQGSYCMVYNATLFDEEEWYFDKNGDFTNAKGDLGTGPDGKTGTYDDGLPRTYDEFFKLLDQINLDNATPFQFPGASQDYFSWLLAEMAAENMGSEQFDLHYTFDGTATLIKDGTINWDTMEYQTEEVQITPNNAYELARHPGLAQALKFAERLMQNSNYYDINNCMSGSFKITQSQLEFIRNPTVSSKKNVAIMVDGSWWENEAIASFKETYGTNATKYDADMEYKWMPFPKATEDKVGGETTMLGQTLDSYCFIKSNIAENKKEAAVKFLQFVHTDAQMAEFTQITSLRKPYDYEVDYSELTSFAQSMMQAYEGATIVTPMDNNALYRYASADFRLVKWMTSKYDAGKDKTENSADVLTQMDGTDYKYSAQDFFDGILTYRKTTQWPMYSAVLGD